MCHQGAAIRLRLTELVGEVEQRLRDSARNVAEHEVGHRFVGATESLRECLEQRLSHLGASGEPRSQVALTQTRAARSRSLPTPSTCESPGSNSDSSPNISPGPRTAITCSRPSLDVWPSLILPSTMMKSRSPASPSEKTTSPRATVSWLIVARSAAAAASSRAGEERCATQHVVVHEGTSGWRQAQAVTVFRDIRALDRAPGYGRASRLPRPGPRAEPYRRSSSGTGKARVPAEAPRDSER